MSQVKDFYEKRGVYGVSPTAETTRAFKCAQNRLRQSLALIESQHPGIVLDIGCGDGFFSQRILENTHAEVWGIDISAEATEKAMELGLQVKQNDLNTGIAFETGMFDLVFCGEVIEHVLDPDFLLDEIWRVLKPGGKLVISTPNLAAWYNRALLLIGIQPIFTDTSTRKTLGRSWTVLGQGSQPVGHLRVYVWAALRDILSEHRFAICKVRALPFLPFPVLYQLDSLIGLFPSLGSNFLVLAQKVE